MSPPSVRTAGSGPLLRASASRTGNSPPRLPPSWRWLRPCQLVTSRPRPPTLRSYNPATSSQRPCSRCGTLSKSHVAPICAVQAEPTLRLEGLHSTSAPEEATAGRQAGADFVRQHLRQLKPYTPIEPFEVLSQKMGLSPQDIVKLDANENPYGPPPEVLSALASLPYPHIYPDPECRALRAALAHDTGVPQEHLLVGCGADELIDLLMRCVLEPGDAILDCPPTFTMYAFDADVNGARTIRVPRNPTDFSLDLPAIKQSVAEHKPKMIFLTSPNNPDGSVLPDSELREVLSLAPRELLVVLDEAYVEFSGMDSRMPWVQEYGNLVVLRTFSKRAALAGLRVGYGAFPLGLAQYLWRAKQPYNVSVAAETAACAALSNPAYLESVRDALISERERLMLRLQSMAVPFLKPFPSKANFILCSVLPPWEALDVKNALAKEGIMVRHYAKPDLKNFIRISTGKPEHTDALFDALERLQRQGPP